MVDPQTFLEELSEFSRLVPKSFLDCVNAFEFITKFSDNAELRTSHRSCLALSKPVVVFKCVSESGKLLDSILFSSEVVRLN